MAKRRWAVLVVSLAVWAVGMLILTVLYKIAIAVREEPLSP